MKLGKYKHFKGNEYQLIHIGIHSETLEEYAVYKKMYDDYSVWVRPLAMFNESIEHEGRKVKRFEAISE